MVRLYLASALQRLPVEDRWDILAGLLGHSEDSSDHNLPAHGLVRRGADGRGRRAPGTATGRHRRRSRESRSSWRGGSDRVGSGDAWRYSSRSWVGSTSSSARDSLLIGHRGRACVADDRWRCRGVARRSSRTCWPTRCSRVVREPCRWRSLSAIPRHATTLLRRPARRDGRPRICEKRRWPPCSRSRIPTLPGARCGRWSRTPSLGGPAMRGPVGLRRSVDPRGPDRSLRHPRPIRASRRPEHAGRPAGSGPRAMLAAVEAGKVPRARSDRPTS